ncbi:sensor domain-containing protein [Halorussus marinus]|uniref:sensor domain-containing protein n=1 Tax=Halorussus marinus TaxID=2505976 RepID=UPI00106DDE6D|nr:sensor domain-containing protein [Halorussus marinus]
MASNRRSASVTDSLRSVFGVPLRLQTYRNLLYLVLAFPLGLVYFVFLSIGLSLGVGLAITVIGIPILLAVLAVSTGLAAVERELATLLLGVHIETASGPTPESLIERAKRLVIDVGTWKALVYLGSKFVIGVVSFVVVTTLLVTATSLLAVPFVYQQPGVYVGVVTDAPIEFHPSLYVAWRQILVGVETVVSVGSWQVTTLSEALAVAGGGVLLGVASLHLLNGLARLSGWYTKVMLGSSTGEWAVSDA